MPEEIDPQLASQSQSKAQIGTVTFIVILILCLILDAIDLFGMGLFSLVIGIPGNILIALISFFNPGLQKELFGWLGGALALECMPIVSMLPVRTGTLIYLNINQLSKLLGLAEKVAKYAKYVGIEPAIAVEKALHVANQATQTVQAVQSGDLRQAYLKAAYLKEQSKAQEPTSEETAIPEEATPEPI